MAQARSSRNVDAREKIRHKILTSHRPGDLISENELIRELGFSRTPIREALAALHGEGLVEIHPKRGTFIRKLDIDEIRALLDLRKVIETRTAIKLAIQFTKHPEVRDTVKEELGAILAAMDAMARKKTAIDALENNEFWEKDMEFHCAICLHAGYRPAADILRRFQCQLRVVAVTALYRRAQLQHVVGEHKKILEALMAAKAREQRRALRAAIANHLRQAARRWFRL